MYPTDYRHPDDTSCPHCGVETEVIGPPGPIHAPTCPSCDIDRRPNPQRKRGEHRREEEDK